MNQEEKLVRIIEILQDGKVSQKDFVDAVEVLIRFVKETKDLTEKELERIEAVFAEKEYEINSVHKRSLDNLKEKLEQAIMARVATIKDGYTPQKGIDYFDGANPDPSDVVPLVLEQIPKEKTVEEIFKQLTSYGVYVRDALELLLGDERLDVKYIKGLEELIEKVNQIESRPQQIISSTSRNFIRDIDLSSQLNGVSTTFSIPAVYSIITVDLSSFPHSLRKGVDYTYTPTSITFTAQIDPAVSLATGQTCILTVISA